MAERSPYLVPSNAGLVAALAVLALVGGALALGPARSRVAELGAQLDRRVERLAGWQGQQRGARVTAVERERWALQWQRLVERVPPAAGDPELVARLARAFQGASVRGLEIERLQKSRDVPEPLRLEVASPVVSSQLALLGDPVRVRFRARYEDLTRVLQDLEARRLPARLETLDVRRAYPNVAVEMTLTVFSRRESAS